jgi:uncharacterized RDD family membrane protein YckC
MKTPPLHTLGLRDRSIAWITDHLIVLIITWPIFLVLYSLNIREIWINGSIFVLFSIGYTLLFWNFKQTSPGKMAFSAFILDHQSGQPPTFKQYVIRYCGAWISFGCLGLGIIWVKFNKQNQAWHDQWAGTHVRVSHAPLND